MLTSSLSKIHRYNHWSRLSFFLVSLLVEKKERKKERSGGSWWKRTGRDRAGQEKAKENEREGKRKKKASSWITIKGNLLTQMKSSSRSDPRIQIIPGIYLLVVLALFFSPQAFLSDETSPNGSKDACQLLQILAFQFSYVPGK